MGTIRKLFVLFLQSFCKSKINFSPFYCFPLFLYIDHWGRLPYLSLLFFGTLHSNGYIFPFLLCFLFLLFSQLFVRPPPTSIWPFCISFSWRWCWSLPPVQCHEPLLIVLQALCLSDLSGSEHIFRISLYSSLKSQQLSMYLLHSFGSKMFVIQWMKNKPDEWITFRLKLPFVRQSYILFKLLFIRAICYMKMRG